MKSFRVETTPPVPDRTQVALSVFVAVCFASLAANRAWVAIFSTVAVTQRLLAVVLLVAALVGTRSSIVIALCENRQRRSTQ